MDDDVTGADERQKKRSDGRHSARESERVIRVFPYRQAVLQYLLVGTVEARIDEPLGAARPFAGHTLEETLSGRGTFERERRGEEDRGFERAFAEFRIIAVAEHERLRLQLVVADAGR